MTARAVLALALVLAACGVPEARDPGAPPERSYALATMPGLVRARQFYDAPLRVDPAVREAYLAERLAAGLPTDRFTILALSGGGPDGAYGAGLLRGWTEAGDRPEFDIVTGISTGALIAPFAFLGPDHDDPLEQFYTHSGTGDILTLTLFRALLGGTALADTAPLRGILEAEVTADLTARIAAEHRRGRRLLIGTTHIDAQRPVIWDIGAIAATGHPDAPAVIRKVMLASASIPGAFPPVLFQVTANGRVFQEAHVDGGVTLSIFVYPRNLHLGEVADLLGVPEKGRHFYLIRNAKLDPEYGVLPLGLVPIAQRAVSTLIKAQTVGNIIEIEAIARRDGFRVHIAHVPAAFSVPATELFDTVYMKALYELGYTQAKRGYPWLGSVVGPQ
jgi:hypothetical protein